MKLASILACVFSGILLGGGFWIYGDGVIQFWSDHPKTAYTGYWVAPGIIATASAVLMNFVDPGVVKEHWEGKLWLFGWLTAGFVSVGLALWIMIADPLIGGGQAWTGISLLLQTILIVAGGILYFLKLGPSGSNGVY